MNLVEDDGGFSDRKSRGVSSVRRRFKVWSKAGTAACGSETRARAAKPATKEPGVNPAAMQPIRRRLTKYPKVVVEIFLKKSG
jgi:hypothetical protein